MVYKVYIHTLSYVLADILGRFTHQARLCQKINLKQENVKEISEVDRRRYVKIDGSNAWSSASLNKSSVGRYTTCLSRAFYLMIASGKK